MPGLSKAQIIKIINQDEDRFPQSMRIDLENKLAGYKNLKKSSLEKILDSVEDAYLRSLV